MTMNGKPDLLLHNRYRIICPLESGQGEFGTAFIAQDEYADLFSHHRCIIRQFELDINNPQMHEFFLEKFKEKVNTLAQLAHPQIPKLYGSFEEAGYFYLVQEFIDGQSLGQIIRQTGPLPPLQVEKIVLSLLSVLEYLHRNKVIHQNIKPDNIILRSLSNEPVLINSGAIKQFFETPMNRSESVSGANLMGPLGFMPPEQSIGRVTYSSDLYSLGITAIYLLTGKLPEATDTDPQTNQLSWQEHIPGLSFHLASVISRAIQFNPNNRCNTANDMLRTLQFKPAGASFTTMSDFSNSDSAFADPTPISPTVAPTPVAQLPTTVLAQSASSKYGRRSLGAITIGAVVLLLSSAGIAYVGMQRDTSQSGRYEQALEQAEQTVDPNPTPTSTPLPIAPVRSFSEVQALQSQGKDQEAVAAALAVSPTSSDAMQAQQLVADLTHVPLNAVLDEVLPPQNVEARQIKFLKGTIENPEKPVVTKLGESRIDANKVTWQSYQKPEGPLQGGQHFVENWGDPWLETYDIVPGKFRLGIIYGCRINAVLQTEAYFHPEVDIGFIKAKLNRMLEGDTSSATEQKLAQVKAGEISEYTFTTRDYLGLIQRTDEGEILIAVREI
ncbi:MAG: serine/threonine-protein kinase [Cyanobacteria bacterium P01_F01_bin.86]